MNNQFFTARIVFHILSAVGWVLIAMSFIWTLIAWEIGLIAPALGVAATLGQALVGLSMIAGAQLGLAQIATANNTAAIQALLIQRDQSAGSK